MSPYRSLKAEARRHQKGSHDPARRAGVIQETWLAAQDREWYSAAESHGIENLLTRKYQLGVASPLNIPGIGEIEGKADIASDQFIGYRPIVDAMNGNKLTRIVFRQWSLFLDGLDRRNIDDGDSEPVLQ